MKNILIIGGAGYVGGALTDFIDTNKYNVVVYDALLFESHYLKPNIRVVKEDVRNESELKKWLDWADAVVDLAAHTGDGASSVVPEEALRVNREQVKFISDNFDKFIIYCSTCSVYGAQDGTLTEESPTNPLSLYAVSKHQAEAFLKNKQSIIFRLGTLFGIGDNYSRPRFDLVANVLTLNAAVKNKMRVFGGDQFRPLLHVKDVGLQIAKTIDLHFDNKLGHLYGNVFNLHSRNLRLVDLAHQIRGHFPKCELEITDIPTGDARNYSVDSQKASNLLNFKPKYSIDFGIEEIKNTITEGRVFDPYASIYHNHNFFKENIDIIKYNNIMPAESLFEELKDLKITSVV